MTTAGVNSRVLILSTSGLMEWKSCIIQHVVLDRKYISYQESLSMQTGEYAVTNSFYK